MVTASISLALLVWMLAYPIHTLAGGPQNIGPTNYAPFHDSTDRLIVKLRDQQPGKQVSVLNVDRMQALSATAGVTLSFFRTMSGGAHVISLPARMTLTEARAVADQLSSDPSVEYAEPDRIMRPMLVPNDPQYANQWHYKTPATEAGGANLPGAWDITTGDASIVVAVIDTGILPNHEDITGRTVAGYDFISNAVKANDGGARDADPTDPGDWVTTAESADSTSILFGCPVGNSSWHGTHVAGTVGAAANNVPTPLGGVGVNWTSMILPVRVLGKCGGFTSDVVDGLSWAAGLPVTGVPNNANPAKVLNLSLGGSGSCGPTYQNAINAVVSAGTVVVVAAGNSNADAVNTTPANCNDVITVAATNRLGGRAYYSNFGSVVEIAAPGGAQSFTNDPNGILSTLDSGTTTALNDNAYIYYQGTSMATPHVAGIVSLILSDDPGLTPSQVLQRLQATARAFPTETGSDCTTSTCGAGIVDAAAAVLNLSPTANADTNQTVNPGTTVNLDGSSSSDLDGTISSYAWTQTAGTSVTLTGANTATPSFTAPATPQTLTFQLGVTDNDGATGTDTVNVTVNAPPTADAGANQTVGRLSVVNLDGSGSSDSDGTIASYAWTQTAGTSVTLTGANTATPSFTAPATPQTLTFQLGVTDNDGATGTDTVTITVQTSGGGGGGGCSLKPDTRFDPMLPLLISLSALYLLRRRRIRRC